MSCSFRPSRRSGAPAPDRLWFEDAFGTKIVFILSSRYNISRKKQRLKMAVLPLKGTRRILYRSLLPACRAKSGYGEHQDRTGSRVL